MKTEHLPNGPGVYLMRDSAGRIIYIGKAKNLKKRVSSYSKIHSYSPKLNALHSLIREIDYIPSSTETDSLLLEQKLIHQIKPVYNTLWKDDKSYPYVKLTLNEEYPRLILTRKKKKDGGKYFGPYPDLTAVKKFMRLLWRKKIAPLRPCKFEFKESEIETEGGLKNSHPSLYRAVQSCIYLHTGECPAPCVRKISREAYLKIASKAELFFKGKITPLKRELNGEMAQASKNLYFEKAMDIRNQLSLLDFLSEKIKIQKIEESNLPRHIDSSRALTELQNVLGLSKPPVRIEAFDISNIQGTEPVASMVVFEYGKPLKSDYRKYKIKTVAGSNDFAMMEEAVKRRVSRLIAEKKKLPDLILVDGGKGQLSSALEALKALKARLPLAALAKENEEIFLPSQSYSIRLPKDSPALHILQRARDEAHRFAVSFHRLRRRKKFFHV